MNNIKLNPYYTHHRNLLSDQDKRHFDCAFAESEEIKRKQWQLKLALEAQQKIIAKLVQTAVWNRTENKQQKGN